MALAPLIPEGFAAADILIALAALLGWIVCLGLLNAWQATIGAVFVDIGNALNYDRGFIHVHFGGPFLDANNAVMHLLSAWATGFEVAAGRFFHTAGQLTEWTAREIAGLANDTLTFAHYLTHQWIPDYLHGIKDLAHTTTKIVTHTVTKVERIEVHTVKVARSAAKSVAAETVPTVAIPHVGEWEWLHRHWPSLRRLIESAGQIAVPGLVAGTWGEIRDLLRAQHFTHVRLRRLEALFGAAAMAAAMANVLGLPNWRCLTRGNIGRASRALCGLGSAAFNDLLGLLVDVLIVEDVCQVITLLEDGLTLIQGPLNGFVSVVDGALCHGDYQAPPRDPSVVLSLPPVGGVLLGGV